MIADRPWIAPRMPPMTSMMAAKNTHPAPTADSWLAADATPASGITTGVSPCVCCDMSSSSPEERLLLVWVRSSVARSPAYPQVAQGGRKDAFRVAYASGVINGAHVILYSRDAEADRTFLRDVL